MNNSSSESETESENVFIEWILENIDKKYENCDLSDKDYYKKLSERIKFYVKAKEKMENDPLIVELSRIAEDYTNEHKDLNISPEAAMSHAIKQHKSLLLETIETFMKGDETDEEDDDFNEDSDNNDVEDANEETDEDDENMIKNGLRTKTMPHNMSQYSKLMRH